MIYNPRSSPLALKHAEEQKGFHEMGNIDEHISQRLLLRIPEVMSMLGLGRTKVYQLIATGELPVVRVGRAVRISRVALEKWVEERQQQDSLI
jgi:excisionase family DNA binding protein